MSTSPFLDFITLVISGDVDKVSPLLVVSPSFATMAAPVGATRQGTESFFFESISHYLYAGDTALHMAAAAAHPAVVGLLLAHGADCRARNRRGAEPLHYSADGNRAQQATVIAHLIASGADPNAVDKSGVAPLHRAVRTRSAQAVRALLDGGANPLEPNKSGSTPLHLAVQTTGASGSGSDVAREQQASIIRLLLGRGARSSDQDANGKTALEAASSKWVRDLLNDVQPC